MKRSETKFNLMTEFTRQKLQAELDKAEQSRKAALKRIGTAGDDSSGWHDSADFDDANRTVEFHTAQSGLFGAKLQRVKLIKPRVETDTVEVGNSVIVEFEGENSPEVFTLLGPDDASRLPGWISHESPLGSSLRGKKAGDIVGYRLEESQQEIRIRILEIKPGEFR